MFLLNRRNTMIYLNSENIHIKNHFFEAIVANSDLNYNALHFVLEKTLYEINIETIISNAKVNKKDVKKAIKYLYNIGSLFIYKKSINEYNINSSFLDLLSIYSLPKSNLPENIVTVRESHVELPYNLKSVFPDLDKYIKVNNLEDIFSFYEELNNTIIIQKKEKKYKLYISYADTKFIVSSIPHEYKDQFNVNYTMSTFVPPFLIIYIIKHLLNNAKDELIVNNEGQFEEVNQAPFSDYLVSDVSFNFDTAKIGDLEEQINNAETLITSNKLNLALPDLLNGDFSNINQVGLVVYGLWDTNKKVYYVYAGKNYENVVINAYKKIIQYYIMDIKNEQWLITFPQDYLLDKALLLANKVYEEYKTFKIDKYSNISKEIRYIIQEISKEFEIYVREFQHSKTYKTYLHIINEKKIYSFDKKSHDYISSIEELIFNYKLYKMIDKNSIKTLLFRFDEQEFDDFIEVNNLSKNIMRNNKNYKLEKVKTLMFHKNLGYSEWKWGFEDSSNPNALLVRKVEVGEFE